MSHLPIEIDDYPSRSVAQIASVARRLKRKKGLALLVVDYLQLVEAGDKSDSRQEQVAMISRGLKTLARELLVPVVALSQLKRKNDDGSAREPALSDLRESGAIEQDADAVIFVHRPDYYTKGAGANNDGETAKIILAKNRQGPTGFCEVLWHGGFVKFENKPTPDTESEWNYANHFENYGDVPPQNAAPASAAPSSNGQGSFLPGDDLDEYQS